MNPPSDPTQLLVYGVATFLVVLGLKLWDRRRDKRLQATAEEAKQQATAAAEHASTAKDSANLAATRTASRASGEQAEAILQTGHDTNAMLLQIAMQLGAVRADVKALRGLPDRVAAIEVHLDDLVLPPTARRRHER